MDPVTTALLIRGAVQLGTAAYQQYQGSQQKKEADLAAQRFGAQQRAITEADEVSDVQVPTLGAELARQSLGQQFVTSVAAVQSAGAAGVLGGIPALANLGADRALDIAAQLNTLEAQRDQFVAASLQQRARREAIAQRGLLGQQLTGAQMASLEARRQQQQALATGIQAIGSATAGIIENQPLYAQQQQDVFLQQRLKEAGGLDQFKNLEQETPMMESDAALNVAIPQVTTPTNEQLEEEMMIAGRQMSVPPPLPGVITF